jgi:hypothetical protein
LGAQVLGAGQAPIADVLITRLALRVPLDQPAGPATLSLVVPGVGSGTLQTLTIAPVERIFVEPASGERLQADLGAGLIQLAGYTVQPGPETKIQLAWRAGDGLIDQDYTVFVHVRDAAGQIVAQADRQPRAGAYPTSLWAPGEFVTDDFTFALPSGNYSLSVGLYEAETGQRLPAMVAGGALEDQIRLTVLNIP